MAVDAIVIGSGFGGAITAYGLSKAGYKVIVLERGRRWDKSNYPRKAGDQWLWNHDRPETENGWLDLRVFPGMAVAQGAAVGGGSLIYANISCEAPPGAFVSGWPEEITYAAIKPHYDAVAKFMNVQPVPDNQWTARMELMRDAAAKIGVADRFKKLELAVTFDPNYTYAKDFSRGEQGSLPLRANEHGAMQGTCAHLGNCDVGCDVYAKNTLDRNYLYAAENKFEAEIRPLHLVTSIEPLDAGGYTVKFRSLEDGKDGSESARLVIVGAGSLGSTELLLRCRDVFCTLPKISDFLGKNWSCNGDFLTPAFYLNRDVQASYGPTIASAIDFQDGSRGGKAFWVEDGGLPNLLVDYLRKKSGDPSVTFKEKLILELLQQFLRRADPARNIMPWFAQGVDAGDGTLSLSKQSAFSAAGELRLDWEITRSQKLIDTIVATQVELAKATGGMPLVPPTWSLFKDLITPHPLGGCNMGASVQNGVVNHAGEVFGYRNLYVVDGAVVPRPLGVNPSRTIGALSARIASIIAEEGR